MSQPNSARKRKLVLIGASVAVVFSVALFVLWYFPVLTFHMVSVSDGPNNWSQRWQTILFTHVTENMVWYPSEDEARRAFENKVAQAETILERKEHPSGLPAVDEQVVATFILVDERFYSIVRLEGKDVYQIYAPSLTYAWAFDRFHHAKT